jgi:hypothetical protein
VIGKVDIDLVGEDDDAEALDASTSSKRRAVGTGQTPRNSIDVSGSASGSSQRSLMRQLGDVIVIEDD